MAMAGEMDATSLLRRASCRGRSCAGPRGCWCLLSPGRRPFHCAEEASEVQRGRAKGPRSHSLEGQARPRVGDLSGRGHPLAAPCFCLTSATNSLWGSGQVTAPL